MTGGGARPRSSIDCCPLLAPEPQRLTAADGVGQGSVIPSHDPSRISRLRPVWRKLPSLRGKSPRVRGFADFYQRFLRETQAPIKTEAAQERRGPIPIDWVQGVAYLDPDHPPNDVPRHRWRQFVDDCRNFLSPSENWAERAARLGWDAMALFGCAPKRPFDYLGSAASYGPSTAAGFLSCIATGQ